MIRKKILALFLIIAFTVIGLPDDTPSMAQAQNETVLVLSIPTLWQDIITPDLLAEFENANPNTRVEIVYTPLRFGGGNSDIETTLQNSEAFVSTADVLFVSGDDLTIESTLAGHFLNLAPLVNSDPNLNIEDYFPAVWQSFQWDQGIWALPVSTDVILTVYDPLAFDALGLAYPNERWTIDDFAYAARALTTYNADGTVAQSGLSANFGGNNAPLLFRSLLNAPVFDATVIPNSPTFDNPELAYILDTWAALVEEGVVSNSGLAAGGEGVPLRIAGINGYSQRFRLNDNETETIVLNASLLPGGVAGLSVQGFAVSGGTIYPEMAYELAKFLSNRAELTSNPFSAMPARQSLVDTQTTTPSLPQGGPGQGGGPGISIQFANYIPAEIQPIVDQGIQVALPTTELRYTDYLTDVLNDMQTNNLDAFSSLQSVETTALSDMQTAQTYVSNILIIPPAPNYVEPGQASLNVAVNMGLGGALRGNQLPNQTEWDELNTNFIVASPNIGEIVLETTNETSLETLSEQYDCFILSSNAVVGNDVSGLLNLDPLMSADFNFDPNDVIGNTLAQLQQDNKTWGLPIVIQPQMLQYNRDLFAMAGVPEPVGGWTIEQFVDALQRLEPTLTDTAPFTPNDPSGTYLLMLIAAYGGIPIDYRTDPPTINFTDPATVEAIRQVLDLAVNGYIEYSAFGSVRTIIINGDTEFAITTDTLSRFDLRGGGLDAPSSPTSNQDVTYNTTYPQGSQFGVAAYDITAGYISANAQDPEACYQWLSSIAQNPQLFDGMPARRTLLDSTEVLASVGEDLVAVYRQLDTLLQDPNTVAFPTVNAGRGAAADFLLQYWLNQAFDNYVVNGADLDNELQEAEQLTLAFQECIATIPPLDEANPQSFFQSQFQCALLIDPNFSLGN